MAAKKTTAETVTVEQTEPTFSKEQLVASERYANRRDAVSAWLDDDKQYTFKQVDEIIDQNMKRKER